MFEANKLDKVFQLFALDWGAESQNDTHNVDDGNITLMLPVEPGKGASISYSDPSFLQKSHAVPLQSTESRSTPLSVCVFALRSFPVMLF